jgi:vitamin B12 transporter
MLLALLSAVAVPAYAQPVPQPLPDPQPRHPPAQPPEPPPPRIADATPATGEEVIVIIGDGPRGGPGDLVGASPAARDGRRALAAAPFVTIVHVDERAGERATLADVLGASVGTHVRSLGGLGAFSSISVRGQSTGHTAVFVDGVPLSRVASVTADLGRFELDELEAAELYRGGAPVELGTTSLGGALNLVTALGRGARGERWRVVGGGGSFGARALHVRWGDGDPDDGLAGHVAVGYAGATGDFTYFHDGGTPLNRSDDGFATRRNNDYDQLDLVGRAGGTHGRWRWRSGVRALGKAQGLPGAATDLASAASLDTLSALADASAGLADAGISGLDLSGTAYALVERQHFRDPGNDVGIGVQDRRFLTLAGGGLVSARLRAGDHELSGAVDVRVDHFRDDDLLAAMSARSTGRRQTGAIAVADDVVLEGGRVVVSPAVRAEVVHTAPTADPSGLGGAAAMAPRTETALSPRLGVRILLLPDLALKVSAGRYARLPTVMELFGDRGFVVGSPDLRAETGTAGDAGLVWAPARRFGPLDRVLVESAAFMSRSADTIIVRSAGGGQVSRAANLGGAHIVGAELALSGRLARTVTATGNYTLLDAVQRDDEPSFNGKQLPQRPRHAVYGRVDVARRLGGRLGALWTDATWIDGNFLDQGNINQAPIRRLFGAGAKLELVAGLTVGVEARNLADARTETVVRDPPPRPDLSRGPAAISDFGGYPLPGRAFYATVEWIH